MPGILGALSRRRRQEVPPEGRSIPTTPGELTSEDKPQAKEALADGVEVLAELQERLYAQDRWAVLLIFQAMDAAGKDGAIKHVMSGVNPQGCQVHSFKAPSAEELDHDYLWRCLQVPARARPHRHLQPLLLRGGAGGARAPGAAGAPEAAAARCVTKSIWQDRYEDIRNFERYLARNGILIRKFFLHVSKKEQKKRFLERLDDPDKNWKFSMADAKERGHWDDYQDAYEDMIRATATKDAPWYVVPADNKWFTRVVVAAAIIDALGSLDLQFPQVSDDKKKELAEARLALERE